ncbi:PREDICTED: islet cell autoantigen 1 [Myotis brandtii]|uniref:islet cell autoantigen 1 n=1 Tax=Myotis brandtii TaxID=109478 RepID=UPI000703D1A3|nr:PREDICTED: islet cell autoantigen 1 [Myotis brandtii]
MSGHKCSYPWDLQDRCAQDQSVVNKMQQKYWETKQAFIKATGKKEDEHVVASDADLDAKLELFHSIQRTCLDLSKAIVLYQKRICFLSQEENELGKFLRSQGFQDKTRAGKMMQATGKALCFSSQQRCVAFLGALLGDLLRIYFLTPSSTTLYNSRSATWIPWASYLMVLKPGFLLCETETKVWCGSVVSIKWVCACTWYTYSVQAQVRLAKKSFDKLKMDVCQKVDLLGASRCNLLSHMLATYQTTLLHFWEKTSHTMAAIHESFRGYQPYEFTTLKSLQDPVKKLAEKEERKKIARQERAKATAEEPSQLISLEEENQHKESSDFKTEEGKSDFSTLDKSSPHNACSDELVNMTPKEGACLGPMAGNLEPEGADRDDMLLLSEIFNASSLDEGEFSKEWAAVFGDGQLKEPVPTVTPGEPDLKPQTGSGFLPSQLLDQNMKDLKASLQEPAKAASDLTAWFSLFADLDPLSNPDAVGKTDKEHELLNA